MDYSTLFYILLVYSFGLHHFLGVFCQEWKQSLISRCFTHILLVLNNNLVLILTRDAVWGILRETGFSRPVIIPALVLLLIDTLVSELSPLEHVEERDHFCLGFLSIIPAVELGHSDFSIAVRMRHWHPLHGVHRFELAIYFMKMNELLLCDLSCNIRLDDLIILLEWCSHALLPKLMRRRLLIMSNQASSKKWWLTSFLTVTFKAARCGPCCGWPLSQRNSSRSQPN